MTGLSGTRSAINCSISRRRENSPAHLAHFRAAIRLARDPVVTTPAVGYVSSRLSAFSDTAAGATVFDLTATAKFSSRRLALQFGVRNIFDKRYLDPLRAAAAVLPRAGRSIFVKLTHQTE